MIPTITIFSTPFYLSKTPQLAPPLLKAYLNDNNCNCNYIDLSIRFNLYMTNNFDYLYVNAKKIITSFLERSLYGKKELDKYELKLFYEVLGLIPLLPHEFLENIFGQDVIISNVCKRLNLSQIEDVTRFYLLMSLNKTILSSLRVCEASNELKSSIRSGIYNDFYQSEEIITILHQAVKSDVVAISANYEEQLLAALVLAYEIKRINPNTFIIIGGSNISRSSLDPRFSKELLKNDFGISAIGLYEGEITLKELAFCIIQHGDIKRVPNLLLYNKDNDQIIATPIVPPPHIDELPTPEYNDEELNLYWKFANNKFDYLRLNVLVSRGCYWQKCSFCVDRYTFNPNTLAYQTRSIYKIINDIEILQTRHRASYFNLITSAMPPKVAKEFSQAIIEKGITANFWTYFRCGNEKNMDLDFFCLLKKAGFDTVVLGTESFDNDVLLLSNKGTSQHENIYSLCGFAKAGIKVKMNIIFDLPPISYDGFLDNIRVIKEYEKFIYNLEMYSFLLLLHSDMGKNPSKFSLKVKCNSDNCIANTGPPDFIIKEYQNPLYEKISQREVLKIISEMKMKINLNVWTKDLKDKLTSVDFSWENSLLLMKPIIVFKYPISYRYQGKRLSVFYVFLEGYMSWFEIADSFHDLINLMGQSVTQAILIEDFFNAFIKGYERIDKTYELKEIAEKFKRFINELVFYGFIKDIIKESNSQYKVLDMNTIHYSLNNSEIAEFHGPLFIPNVGTAI